MGRRGDARRGRGRVRVPPRKGLGGIRSFGGRGVPPVGIGSGRGWGESERQRRGWTIITHHDPDGGKIEEGIEGGENGRTHARNFERALYVARIAPPMLPAVIVVCFPPWTRVTIRDRRSFGREEEDEDDDGNCSQEREDYEGTMTATNYCSGRGRRNAEGRWKQNIVAIGRRRRLHRGTSRRLPPRPSLADIVRGRRDAARKCCRLAAMSTTTTTVRMTAGGSE
jgi:hypothetical protein